MERGRQASFRRAVQPSKLNDKATMGFFGLYVFWHRRGAWARAKAWAVHLNVVGRATFQMIPKGRPYMCMYVYIYIGAK